jgi:hypothetical protein
MKTIKSFAMIIGMIMAWFNIQATPEPGDYIPVGGPPVVPISVYSQGNQRITQYLLQQPDHVSVSFSGKSLMHDIGPVNLDRDWLEQNGYNTAGSFTQLSSALERVNMAAEIVPQPSNYTGDNYYYVTTEVTVYNAFNQVILQGNGWSNIRDGKDGNLVADPFQTWMYLPPNVLVDISDNTSAKLVGWNGDAELDVQQGKAGHSLVLLASELAGSQRNILLYNGKLSSWNLSTGQFFLGRNIFVNLGKLEGGDVMSLTDSLDHNRRFYLDGDSVIYGDFPLIDLTVKKKVTISHKRLGVGVWGNPDIMVYPTRVLIHSLIDRGTKTDMEVPPGYDVNLAPGEYQIITIWGNQISDPSDNPNPGKG